MSYQIDPSCPVVRDPVASPVGDASAPPSLLDISGGGGGLCGLGKGEPSHHFPTIGGCLLVAETTSSRVGIPILFPTARVRSLASERHSPLNEFVRTTLVTVPTSELELYVEQLLMLGPKTTSAELFIEEPSVIEKLPTIVGLPVVVAALEFVVFGITNYSPGEHPLLLTYMLALVLMSCMMGYFVTTQYYRHWSFYRLLLGELTFRRGGGSEFNSMRLTPA